jgi:hypothetical protein
MQVWVLFRRVDDSVKLGVCGWVRIGSKRETHRCSKKMSQKQSFFTGPHTRFAALLAVILVSAVLRVLHFSGYWGLDDAEYAHIAYQVADGNFFSPKEYGGPPVFPLRVGLILPTSLIFRAFGLSEWSMVVYPLLLSILMLPLIYVCTASAFGHRAGFIAVALLGIVPMELDSATQLLPDMPGAFYAALGVTAIMLAGRAGGEGNWLSSGLVFLLECRLAFRGSARRLSLFSPRSALLM